MKYFRHNFGSKINFVFSVSQIVWRGSQDARLQASADHCKDE